MWTDISYTPHIFNTEAHSQALFCHHERFSTATLTPKIKLCWSWRRLSYYRITSLYVSAGFLKTKKTTTWHRAQAIPQIWRNLLSFCFFWQSPKCQRPHEWIWGLGGMKRAQFKFRLWCADCDTTELNPNFQLIQQLYCLDPTVQQRQCWGGNNNLNETNGFKSNIWSIKLLKSRVNYPKTHRDRVWSMNLTQHAWVLTVKPSAAWHQESPHSSTVYHFFSCNHHSLSQLACGEGGVTPWTGASLWQGHTQRQSTTICTHTDAQLKDAS